MTTIPIACDRSVFTPAQRQRHTALWQQLAQAVQDVRELPDGYALRYATDDATWMTVAEFVSLEQRCCPFLAFTLTLDQHKNVWLHLTGEDDVKAFLTMELAGITAPTTR